MSGTSMDMLSPIDGGVRLDTQKPSATNTAIITVTPAQIQATGGRFWVLTVRSRLSEANCRMVASDPAVALGLTPNSVELKSEPWGSLRVGSSPLAAASRSERKSDAVWKRSNLSLLNEWSTTASMAGDTCGLRVLGATAASLMCW